MENASQFIQPGKASVLIDGQFGSTGKGLLAAYLAGIHENYVHWATTNASANAGHWTKYAEPYKDFCCFHLPTFGVVQNCNMYINSGAVIDPDLLNQEVDACGVDPNKVYIHPHAAVIEQSDKDVEEDVLSQMTRISSTRKGVGSAYARKVLRTAMLAKDHKGLNMLYKIQVVHLGTAMNTGMRVSVEVPQGYSLSLSGKFYPYVTSREVSVSSALSAAMIHPHYLGNTAMAVRTMPIRVGSIPDLGYSGNVYPDQEEVTWESINIDPELTTVTKRERRLFTWSNEQYVDAVVENRPDLTFLNFCNYVTPDKMNQIRGAIQSISRSRVGKYQVLLTGWGPRVEDVMEVTT